MSKNLVIVESPAKAKTIEKYLGKDFGVLASYGHVRDLVPKGGAVDPDDGFAMKYRIIERNEKHVNAIIKALKKADALYLATDPDREGEAISWHLVELLKEKGVLEDKPVHRVVFHEITKNAIVEAIQHPRDISNDLVGAQQARRALDYLVGFNLSPLLWKKVQPGLSAGRVQSPALRLIVERELEIEAFIAREYWSIEADFLTEREEPFSARLNRRSGKSVRVGEKGQISSKEEADAILAALEGAEYKITSVERKEVRRKPAPPFITSSLQQEASRRIRMSPRASMAVAQQLYQGIPIGSEGEVGLITYMRTDSTRIAGEALRGYIAGTYPAGMLPEKPNFYKSKKGAQDAHEAIRPTSAARTPQSLAPYLNEDQLKLYTLIWKRYVACQMTPAILDQTSVDINTKEYEA